MQPILFSTDMWRLSSLIGAILCVVVLTERTHWSRLTRVVVHYYTLVSVWTIFYLPIGAIKGIELAKKAGAIRVLFATLLTPLIAGQVTPRMRDRVRLLCFVLLASNAILRAMRVSLWLGNTHDNLVFAIFLPWALRHYGRWAWILMSPLATSLPFGLVGKGALVVLWVQLVLWLIYTKRVQWILAAFTYPITILFIISDEYRSKFNILYRYDEWREILNYWEASGQLWFGMGPGSFEWISAVSNFKYKWCWMHGDWAQILFEFGYVGLGVAVLFFLFCLFNYRKSFWKTATLLGLGVGMLVYSPIQFFWCQFLIVFVMGEKNETTNDI